MINLPMKNPPLEYIECIDIRLIQCIPRVYKKYEKLFLDTATMEWGMMDGLKISDEDRRF